MFWQKTTIDVARLALVAALAMQAPGAIAARHVKAAPTPPAAAQAPMPAAAPAVTPQSSVPLCSRVDIAPVVHIPVGKTTVMRPNSPVLRILLGNPENARAARPAETPDKKKDRPK